MFDRKLLLYFRLLHSLVYPDKLIFGDGGVHTGLFHVAALPPKRCDSDQCSVTDQRAS